jgi:hypothetical protein
MGENIVNMGPVNQEVREEKKLSYEELEQAAQNLSAQYQNVLAKFKELAAKHQELMQNNYFVRLEWLYRVINSDKFPEEFIDQCTKEFITLMTPEEEDNKD